MSQTQATTQYEVELPEPGVWEIDPTHSVISGVARHLMVAKVRGYFRKFSGSVHVAERPEDSWVEVEIDASSIDTGTEDRDNHLRSPDFLDAERYPKLTFKSTKVEPGSNGDFRLHGDLTIRDITRPVVLDAHYEGVTSDPWGGRRIAFSASTELAREDWGMTWNVALEGGGILVSKTIKVEIEIEAVKS
jgi:polyisoprenoid-binding protein YceI